MPLLFCSVVNLGSTLFSNNISAKGSTLKTIVLNSTNLNKRSRIKDSFDNN